MKWNCTNLLVAPVAALALTATVGTALGQSSGNTRSSAPQRDGQTASDLVRANNGTDAGKIELATANPLGGKSQITGGVAGAGADCQYDDGAAENALGWTNGGVIAWAQRFEACASQVNDIATTYGNPGGTPGVIAGDPVGYALLTDTGSGPGAVIWQGQGTIDGASIGTNVFQVLPVDPPQAVPASFYAVVWVQHGAGSFPAPMDETSAPGHEADVWLQGTVGGIFGDYDPGASTELENMAGIGFPAVWMLRVNEGTSGPAIGACCTGDGPQDCLPDTLEADCLKLGGTFLGTASTCDACPIPVECPAGPACPGDIDNNGQVNVQDILLLLAQFGPCPGCPADIDGNGNVNVQDVLLALANFGPCPAGDGGPDSFNEPEPCGDDVNGGCNAVGDSTCCIDNGPGMPGCDDQTCQDAVCAQDAFCCDTTWDQICADLALSICDVCQPDPEAYTPIKCGQTVCGTAWADGATRDTDWYTVTITESMTLTWDIHAEFPAAGIIVNDDCGDGLVIHASATGAAGVPFSIEACVQPGTYRLFVAPNAFEGYPCNGDNDYVATLSCEPCVITGACCLDGGSFCDDLTVAECNKLGGEYQGDDTLCAETNCPQPCPLGEHNENEPCGDDHNGGCNNDPPNYGQICCGDIKHGNAWADADSRDTDWFAFEVENDNTCVQIQLDYDFGGLGALLILLTDDCEGPLVADSVQVGPNTRLISTVVDAGSYVIALATDVFAGLPCPGGDYTLTLNCSEGPCENDGFICQSAISVEINGGAEVVDNTGYPATAPLCGGFGPGEGTVWFSVIGDGTILTAESCGSSVAGTVVTVYCAGCDNAICVDGANESGTGCGNPFLGSVEWCSENGVEYLIAVRQQGAGAGDISLAVTSTEEPCNFAPNCEPPNACVGACGGSSPQGCFCDDACIDFGDCCPNVCEECPELVHCVECEAISCSDTEGEACGTDTNGGCNSEPPIFDAIACGGTVCGNLWAAPVDGIGNRDTDWYQFTLTETTQITWSLEASENTLALIIQGVDDCATSAVVADATGCAPVAVATLPAGTHAVWAGHVGFDGHPCPGYQYTGTMTCSAPNPPPANDSCAGAIDITANINGAAVNGDNTDTSLGQDPDAPAGSPSCQFASTPEVVNHTLWYSFTAPAGGSVTLDGCGSAGSAIDMTIAVYSGSCGSLVEVGCGEDECGGPGWFFNTIVGGLTPGETYYIMVGNSGFGGQSTGTFSFTISG